MAGKERAAEALRDLLEALREKLEAQSRDERAQAGLELPR